MASDRRRASEDLPQPGPPTAKGIRPQVLCNKGPKQRTNHCPLGVACACIWAGWSWTSRWDDPEASARRAEIQRIRHAEDPAFHDKALSNLKKGRLNEWKKEQILQAIRDFEALNGRSPRYEELRASSGLPDYKTIWRKFGSSRDAIKAANDVG
jgi:hypothetical protein